MLKKMLTLMLFCDNIYIQKMKGRFNMISKFNKLKKQIELQMDEDIFDLNNQAIFSYYGVINSNYYNGFRCLIIDNDYKINKNVFDEYNFHRIKKILEEMARVWPETNYVDEPYIDEEDKKWCYEYNERMADICLECIDKIETKYEYYLKLNKLYEYILDDDTECKTLPNKYTQRGVLNVR